MKSYLVGLLALAMAVGASAFTRPESGNNTSYYWYHTMDNGTVINPGAPPPSSTFTDPFSCGGGPTKICSKAFNDYDRTNFAPLGSAQLTVKKPN